MLILHYILSIMVRLRSFRDLHPDCRRLQVNTSGFRIHQLHGTAEDHGALDRGVGMVF